MNTSRNLQCICVYGSIHVPHSTVCKNTHPLDEIIYHTNIYSFSMFVHICLEIYMQFRNSALPPRAGCSNHFSYPPGNKRPTRANRENYGYSKVIPHIPQAMAPHGQERNYSELDTQK